MFRTLLTICLLLMPVAGAAQTHAFTWENLLLAAIKLDPAYDYAARSEGYMRVFRSEIWNRYHNDEFELQDKLKESEAIFRQRVQGFDLDGSFQIVSSAEFGDYDFERAQWPLKGLSSSTFFRKDIGYSSTLPNTIEVYFDNPELLGNISMEREAARRFLNGRKRSSGYVDRTVHLELEFRALKAQGQLGNSVKITSRLLAARVFSDKARKQLLASFQSH